MHRQTSGRRVGISDASTRLVGGIGCTVGELRGEPDVCSSIRGFQFPIVERCFCHRHAQVICRIGHRLA